MIHQIKYVDGKWDLKENPVIGDVIVLYVGRKRHILKVCRHMNPNNICEACAAHSILRRHCMYCGTVSDYYLCGVGTQNLQPYDILEEL